MSDSNTLLTVEDVSKAYAQATVLDHVSLSVESGEAVAIVGPSGCGKSTLLNLMGALDHPDSGSVLFEGQKLSDRDENALATFRNESIGFIFQSHHLLPQCTAIENVLIPTLVGNTTPDHRARAESLLDRVGLGNRANDLPGKLSGGEQQRIAVVRALINSPKLLLADEPTGSLSRSGSEDLTSLLLDLNREKHMALVVVTHSLTVADRMDRVYALDEGKLVNYTGGAV